MEDFLQTIYEAFFFIEQDVVVGYVLVKMDCEQLYFRQFEHMDLAMEKQRAEIAALRAKANQEALAKGVRFAGRMCLY